MSTIHKESATLFIGNQQISAGAPLFLRSNPEGISYFNTWDAGLTSLETSNTERFESKFANQILGHEYNCTSIKILDDIAAVSYGNYTDLNKTVYQDTGGGLYKIWYSTYSSYYGGAYDNRYTEDFALPILNKDFSELVDGSGNIGPNTNFSNLFILVEYDGYFTANDGTMETRPLTQGRYELFQYSESPITGTFYFDPVLKCVLLRSKYSVSTYSDELVAGGSISSSRLVQTHVSNDLVNLSLATADIGASGFAYGFVGYNKVSLIKYIPVVECGKIDLYCRKSGTISSELAQGKVQSNSHGLKNGDIIKISGALNSYGKNTVLNGIKYVQVNTTNIFSLYEDSEMLQKTATVNGVDPKASWMCVGNVYSENLPDGWEYKQTIFSPTGRNGYTLKTADDESLVTHASELNPPLSADFAQDDSYYDILVRDLGYTKEVDETSVVDESVIRGPLGSLVPVRRYPSQLDFLWSDSAHYITGYQFGCSVDFKKINETYYLLVGERGISTHCIYDLQNIRIMPANNPSGKVHLFTLAPTVNKNITYTYVETFYAQSGDSSIPKPDNISQNTYHYVNFYNGTQNSSSLALNSTEQQIVLEKLVVTDKFLKFDYWFGAYLFHFDIISATRNYPEYDYNGTYPYTSAYFSNFYPRDLEFENNGVSNFLFSADMYPFCDSFGKSVCLSNSGADLLILAASKNKTILYPNSYEYDETGNFISDRRHLSYIPDDYGPEYSVTDCGYVHCIKYSGGTSTKLNKLSHTGVETLSGGIDGQYLRAEKFAQTIKEMNGYIYFGCSRPEEFYNISMVRPDNYVLVDGIAYLNTPGEPSTSIPIFVNESSRIYCYKYGTSYTLYNTILNELNNNYYYIKDVTLLSELMPNQKELTLQNKKYNNRRMYRHTTYQYDNVLFFPTDRFGDYFDINKELLVINSLDIINEVGSPHTDLIAGPDLACDYIHVYEAMPGMWAFASKFSASIDSVDSRYSYEDLFDNSFQCINSLRDLGNYDFLNNSESSKTWDIDLTNSFVLADDRIILKDPFGYSVFRRAPGITREIQAPPTQEASITTIYPYFKFDEHFNAIYDKGNFDSLCNFAYTQYCSFYEYNTGSYVINRFNPGGLDLQLVSPVYFFSLPVSYTSSGSSVKLVVQVGVFDDPDSVLKIKLHRMDPRIYSEANYINTLGSSDGVGYGVIGSTFVVGGLPGGSACNQDGSYLLYTDVDPNGEIIYDKGVLSIDNSVIISPTSVTDSTINNYKIYEFDIPHSLLEGYVLFDNQLKTGTYTSNGEILTLDDSIKDTYDNSIEVIRTLIISFNFGNMSYSVPQYGDTKIYQIQSIFCEMNIPAMDLSSSTNQFGNYSNNVYSCIYNKVVNYAYDTILNNCSLGDRVYTNPILGIGTSNTDAYNVYRNDDRDGDVADSYGMLSIDKYNIFESEGKIVGNDIIAVRSLDIQPMTYLPLYMSTSRVTSGSMNLYTSQATNTIDNADLYIKGAVGLDNSFILFVGPSTYTLTSPLYIRGTVVIGPPSGESDNGFNLVMPETTRLVGELSSSEITLYMDAGDLDAGMDLFLQPPKTKSNNFNLFMRCYVGLATYSDNSPPLFINGLYVQENNTTLSIVGGPVGLMSLVIAGPLEKDSDIPLTMYSYSQDTIGDMTLVMFEYPYENRPLHISGPKEQTSDTNLFIKYDLRYANSIDNGGSDSCSAYINEEPFDISVGTAESLINGTNSIVEQNYSAGGFFGYEPNQVIPTYINTDYLFYKQGRFQKITDTNGEILAIGIREGAGEIPKLLLFNFSGKEATFITKKDDYYDLATSTQHFGTCLVMDVKVSEGGLSAISSYIEVFNSADQFVRGYFIISIYDTDGTLIKEFRRAFTDQSNEAFLSNHMGATLCWDGEDLLYTKEDDILGTIQKREGPSFNTESLVLDITSIPNYTELENNWLNYRIPFYRLGFGHRIEKVGSHLYVSVPLISYKTLSIMSSPDNINFSGAVYDFLWNGSSYVINASSVINSTSDVLYGYDMCPPGPNGLMSVSKPIDHTVVRLNSSMAYVDQTISSDLNFGLSIENCHDAVYTIVNDSLYNINTGRSLSYPITNDEIISYIPPGNAILYKEEKIKTAIIAGGKTFILREFFVIYGLGFGITIRKLSLLDQSRPYDTPTLFIMNQGLDLGVDLFLQTLRTEYLDTTLNIEGMYTGEALASLFIRHLPDNMGDEALQLKLQGNDPIEWADVVGLALYGSTTSDTFFLSSSCDLYCGGEISGYGDTIPLNIFAPTTGDFSGEIPLFMNMGADAAASGTSSGLLGINILNTQTESINTVTLVLNSTYGSSEGLPLWMTRKGPGGGEENEEGINLVLENKNIGSDVNLYTNAVYGIDNNVTLVFLPSSGADSKIMKLQIFGYRE